MRPARIRTAIIAVILIGLIAAPAYAVPMTGETETTPPPPVPVQDIDLGDYQAEMYVGKNQLLMVTVLPINSADQAVTYSSGNTNVASVNMMGRITASALGETEISVSAGEITRKFILKVTAEPDVTDPSQPHIAVMDIEISNFKDIIKIDETVDITASALPKDAAKPEITYSSSKPGAATINSSGQIKGISAGTTTITAEADGYRKSMTLTVKAATANIEINESYLVINAGDVFRLSVRVLPSNADQTFTYKSTSPEVASVSGNGLIKALKPGTSSVIVSTWDTSKIVSIIVNEKSGENSPDVGEESQEAVVPVNPDQTELVKKIAGLPDNGEITAQGSACRIVTSAVLKELYGTRKTLVIKYPDYAIVIPGADIKNIENELNTALSLSNASRGLEFAINDNHHLPGKIQIQFFNQTGYAHLYLYYAHLYLYNETKNDYEEINTLEGGNKFYVDTSGKYTLTHNKISNGSISWIVILIAGIVGVGLGIAYIAVKKKHWFW
jgi:uncharacterized protein YjdB